MNFTFTSHLVWIPLKYLSYFAAAFVLLASCSTPAPIEISITPYPTQIETGNGFFNLSPNTQLLVEDQGEFAVELAFFQAMMQQALGQNLSDASGKNVLEIRKSSNTDIPESYHLAISTNKVILEAGDAEGIFYGMITLKQLLPVSM